eukprot:TRINITY_DN11934_c0_g2_i2.p1 TRINITY_DN11934_c0_g2~~TRINITY_DN11934_c0_g2_i2.p1  ORF type:complete len:203 (-),score=21.11 TRINITY_DN11934_c0_g2_i2:139-747(-)
MKLFLSLTFILLVLQTRAQNTTQNTTQQTNQTNQTDPTRPKIEEERPAPSQPTQAQTAAKDVTSVPKPGPTASALTPTNSNSEPRFFLNSGERLHSGEMMTSPNGLATLELDPYCNVILRYNGVIFHDWLDPQRDAQGPCKLFITRKSGTIKLTSKNNKVKVLGISAIKGAKYYQLVINNNGRLRLYAVNETWDNIPPDDDD